MPRAAWGMHTPFRSFRLGFTVVAETQATAAATRRRSAIEAAPTIFW